MKTLGVGGLARRRPDQQYRPAQGGVTPGPRSIIRARQVIVSGTNEGIFIYSPKPAHGNLIGSWAGQAGTDLYGNAYPQGISVNVGAISGATITGSTFDGTDFVISTAGAFFYSGTPAAGNLIASIASIAGNDSFGNAYLAGIASYTTGESAQILNAGITLLKSSGVLAPPAVALSDTTTGNLVNLMSTGLIINLAAAASAVQVLQNGDTNNRLAVDQNGKMSWGPGNAVADTDLYRSAAGLLKTDNSLEVAGTLTADAAASAGGGVVTIAGNGKVAISAGAINPLLSVTDTAAAPSSPNIVSANLNAAERAIGVRVTGDTADRGLWRSDGSINIGPGGSTAQDTNLYRGAAATLQTDSAFALTNQAAPALLAGAVKLYGASGALATVNADGLALDVVGGKLANVAGTTVTSINITALGALTVPGGDVQAGTAFGIRGSGSFSMGTTPSNARMLLYWGGIAGTIIAEVDPPITAGLAGAGWWADAEVDWISATSCEATLTVGWHTAAGTGGSVVQFVVTLTTGLVTTGSNDLTLAWKWGSVPTGTSLQCDVVRPWKWTR